MCLFPIVTARVPLLPEPHLTLTINCSDELTNNHSAQLRPPNPSTKKRRTQLHHVPTPQLPLFSLLPIQSYPQDRRRRPSSGFPTSSSSKRVFHRLHPRDPSTTTKITSFVRSCAFTRTYSSLTFSLHHLYVPLHIVLTFLLLTSSLLFPSHRTGGRFHALFPLDCLPFDVHHIVETSQKAVTLS